MIQIKHILSLIIILNVIILILVYDASRESVISSSKIQKSAMRHENQNKINETQANNQEIFINNEDNNLNNEIILQMSNPFEVLGAYPEIGKKYFNTYPDKKIMYSFADHGLYNDDDYCEITDIYNLDHPENMFEQMNFFTDYGGAEIMTRSLVIDVIGTDTMPSVSTYMGAKAFNSRKYHLPLHITNYFTKKVDMHLYHQIGKHFLCATQMYNHIPGHGALKRKDLIVGTIERYAAKFKTRPQCFDKNKFFPLSYRLYQKAECVKFFKILKSKKYKASLAKEPIQYLLKIGVGAHKASGVSLIDQAKTDFLMTKYQNGTECGKNFESYVAQTYIANPLLLDRDNKFDFRIYMLVASTNPLIVYYHDGLIRVSLTPYNKSSENKGTHLTNTALSLKVFEEKNTTTIAGMTEEEAKAYMLWNFQELESYLLESGKISDPKWLDNYLRPAFRRAFVHIARMSYGSFWKQSNVYEMFGLDFMLDDKMNLWLIECNSSPQLPESNGREFMVKMMTDLFEIEYAYYRSRMKRVVDVIKRMQEEQKENKPIDIEKWKAEYQEASKNRLEPEYSISKNSSFTLIVDENLSGGDAYFGNIPSECADIDKII